MSDKRKSKAEQLDADIRRLAEQCKLDSWTAYVTAMKVPNDIYAALASGRPELIKIIEPRALTADEAKPLFDIIASLIETNMALREHAEQLAIFTHTWTEAFKQLRSVGDRIERFANFNHSTDDEDEEEQVA